MEDVEECDVDLDSVGTRIDVTGNDVNAVLKSIGVYIISHSVRSAPCLLTVQWGSTDRFFVSGCISGTGTGARFLACNYNSIKLCVYNSTDDSLTVRTATLA